MNNIHILIIIIIFTLKTYSINHTQNEALAKLWDVSDNQLPNLLENEKKLIMVDKIVKQLIENYEKDFGGTYIDLEKNLLIIYTLNFTKADIIKTSPQLSDYLNLTSFVPADNSLYTLKKSFNETRALAKKLIPKSTVLFIDIKLNDIVIILYHKHSGQNEEFVEKVKQYNLTLEYVDEIVSTAPHRNIVSTIPIMGGDGLYNPVYNSACSVGFWAKRKNLSDNYIVTAGHCSKPHNPIIYLRQWDSKVARFPIGPIIFNKSQPIDVSLVNITNKEDIEPRLSIRNADSEINDQLLINKSLPPVYSHGAHLCKSGYTTHVTCGYIRALDALYINPKRKIKSQMIITSMSSNRGDSGGTVFSYAPDLRHASLNGIHIAGAKVLTIVLPIERIINSLNLELP
ncbi:14971_t:CDS:1 [Dentiscutata erythropus]|uniref:14971_t:CDS:1 n=1 Tax=Dentiscutata erythropus TaxID=1348616 RepID=A0A9N9EHA9_9GLOM|nr:14971_t:CDS:1 [Dentiscutata erythropus]